jgi:transcriptional regulator GlxA family with amidase domain
MSEKDIDRDLSPPITLGLLLIPGFALMGYAALVEAFRAANTLSGKTLYEWVHVSPDGQAVEATNGARILADARVGDKLACRVLFVFAGGDPRRFHDPATYGWLRQLSRGDCAIAGVSGGLYVIDGPVITCAGGTAGLDLALALIARDHGADLAARVGEWFIRTTPRDAAGPQRLSPAERHGTTNHIVLQALALIEARLDRPLPRDAIAQACGRSLRQIERLFHDHLGRSMAETALGLRLDSAAHRLRTTDAAITQIALDCGFVSAAHFSRRIRQRFGVPPSALRHG